MRSASGTYAVVSPKGWGFIYTSAPVYDAFMWALRRGNRHAVFRAVSDEAGDATVLELAPGTAPLLQWIPLSRYRALELHPGFVRRLQAKGVSVFEGDLLTTPWPDSECIVMVESLYQFLPRLDVLIEKFRRHGARKVILSESVRHWAHHPRWWVARAASLATKVEFKLQTDRFDEASLKAFYFRLGCQQIRRIDCNLMGVWNR